MSVIFILTVALFVGACSNFKTLSPASATAIATMLPSFPYTNADVPTANVTSVKVKSVAFADALDEMLKTA